MLLAETLNLNSFKICTLFIQMFNFLAGLYHVNMCFGCSKEPSHRDGSFELPQHMFWLRNKKNNFQLHTLIWGPVQAVKGLMNLCKCAASQEPAAHKVWT